MNNTPAEILQAYLVAKGLVAAPAPNAVWPCFISAMPDDAGNRVPDEAACAYDTEGVVRTRLLAGGFTAKSYGIQLKARGLGYPAVFTLLSNIADAVEADVSKPTVSVGGNSYRVDGCRRTSNVISMGQDEKRRATCSVNFLLDLVGH